jgi:hypothetical protein
MECGRNNSPQRDVAGCLGNLDEPGDPAISGLRNLNCRTLIERALRSEFLRGVGVRIIAYALTE